VENWRVRLANEPPGLKVGLVWAGNPEHVNDHLRSASLAAYAPFGAVPGVRFYSLQSGAGSDQAASPPPGMNLVNLTPELGDMANTAALIQNLDLVITVDTSASHLVGSIGKPVWLLLHFMPDWRWMFDRTDTPWYPTMRLFRQTRPRDWSGPIAEAVEALKLLAGGHSAGQRDA